MANITKIRLSGSTYTIVDETAIHSLAGYPTTQEVNSAITAATDALATSIAEQGYQTSGQVQSAIDASVSGKANSSDVQTLSGTVIAHTASTDIHVTSADKTAWNAKVDTSDLAGYADAVKYNTSTKYMEFFHNGTGGTKVFEFDASPFLVDGMIDSVSIKTITSGSSQVEVLAIVWNSDAGKQETDIPLTAIFDPSNYYTTTQTDSKITEATSGKADTSAVTSVNNALTAHTSNSNIHVTSTDKTTWSGKQDALVSGTNIKTINGTSILGSGNITIEQGTVDQTVIQNSANAVAGGAVYTALAGKNGTITLDSETLVIS